MTFKGETVKVRLFHCTKAYSCGVKHYMPQDGQPLHWPHFLRLPNGFICLTQQQGQSCCGNQHHVP